MENIIRKLAILVLIVMQTELVLAQDYKGGPCGLKGNVQARIQECNFKREIKLKDGLVAVWSLVTVTEEGFQSWQDMSSGLIWGDTLMEKNVSSNQYEFAIFAKLGAAQACASGKLFNGQPIQNNSLKWRIPTLAEFGFKLIIEEVKEESGEVERKYKGSTELENSPFKRGIDKVLPGMAEMQKNDVKEIGFWSDAVATGWGRGIAINAFGQASDPQSALKNLNLVKCVSDGQLAEEANAVDQVNGSSENEF